MRILWVGNAPFVGSGYGEQANLFLPRLQRLGHEVAVLANYGLNGMQMALGGIHHYPSDGNWANDRIETAAANWKADLVIVLHDAWVMRPDDWGDAPPVAIWAPVDHHPIPPAVLGVLNHDRVRPIAMSTFGRDLMDTAGLNPLYVPHGIDSSLFRPQPELRDQVRDRMEIPQDAFLVGMVAANRGNPEVDRKSFDKAIRAFGRFATERDDAYLYLHTQMKGAIDLETMVAVFNIPAKRVRWTPDEAWHLGIPRELVATLYQSFDVLLAPSMGEGFGIPLLEAQASGVPVITSPHSAMLELGQNGWFVDGDPKWDPLQTADFFDPYVPSIHEKLHLAYEARGDEVLRRRVVEFAQAYDADLVVEEFWKPTLEALGAQSVSAVVSRAERRRVERAAQKHPAPGRGAVQARQEVSR